MVTLIITITFLLAYFVIGGIFYEYAKQNRWSEGVTGPYYLYPPPDLVGIAWPFVLLFLVHRLYTGFLLRIGAKIYRMVTSAKIPKARVRKE
jgi:tryptophan-rich sensory protein